MQIAYYRRHRKPTPVYETGATRSYRFGRTETIRSCSWEVVALCKAMSNKKASKSKTANLDLLKRALARHVELTALASQGQGVDRHLLGLKMAANELGASLPTMFTDGLMDASATFRLSTSNTTRNICAGGGFGPGVPDGYGVCYGLNPHMLQFFVTSFRDDPTTNSESLAQEITKVLPELLELLSSTQSRI
mmetsp:Transcript_74674/g.175256  ORF Transcript_74674/g.175256 Transcript_74674/m.175256 type:complete len:192 (-) Transcript_74674:30-605(-)